MVTFEVSLSLIVVESLIIMSVKIIDTSRAIFHEELCAILNSM